METRSFRTKTKQALSSLARVGLPTLIATVVGFLYFDNLSLYIRSTLDVGTIRLLMDDEAQFIQNFLTVIGLLFSILAGNAYSALYQQQEVRPRSVCSRRAWRLPASPTLARPVGDEGHVEL